MAVAIVGSFGACAVASPASATALDDRVEGVLEDVWANASSLRVGMPEEHLALLEATIEKVSARYGERSAATMQALTDTAGLVIGVTRRYDLALPFVERNLTLARAVYGKVHRETAYALHDLALVYAGLGTAESGQKAEAALREALEIRLTLLGDAHKETAGAKADLARQLLNRNPDIDPAAPELREAEELASAARKVLEPILGSIDFEIVALRRTLLECALVQKNLALAATRAREAIKKLDGAPASGLFPNVSARDLLSRIRAAQARELRTRQTRSKAGRS